MTPSASSNTVPKLTFFLVSFILCFFMAKDIAAPNTKNLTNLPLGKGVFLVADPHMGGPYFSNSVVLLLEYDQTGAFGVIVNRPTNIPLAQIVPNIKGVEKLKGNMFLGGPVARNNPLMLLRTDKKPEKVDNSVLDGVYYITDHKYMIDIIQEMGPEDKVRVYAGYAGWYPGQLEAEVERGGWVVLKADPYTLFDKNPDKIWDDLISGKSGISVRLQQWQSAPEA
ncbi:MAG: YqgE/AlgH family protein [Nitrospinota bacterium]